MKRISLILICMMMMTWPAYSQFWISINWENPHCEQCMWMEQALHLYGRRAADYHRIIHKYGKKIEREARRSTRYWEASAERIFALRMERDRALQLILNPEEFRLYVRFIRESPVRIHDYQGWFRHPHHPEFHPSLRCLEFEDHYWTSTWHYRGGHWNNHFVPKHAIKHDRHRPEVYHQKEWRDDRKGAPHHRADWHKESRKEHDKDQKHTNKKTDKNNERKRNDFRYKSRD